MKPLLPVALDLYQRPVLIVGGGVVASRKAAAMLECGAKITVVAPGLVSDFPEPVERRIRTFRPGDCIGFDLVVAATDDPAVNSLVRSEARSMRILVNDAGGPENSDIHTASVVRRGDIAIGVTTGGTSPVLARHLRERIEAAIGPEYGLLTEIVGPQAMTSRQRGDFWNLILASDILDLLRAGDTDTAKQRVQDLHAAFE